MTAWALAATGMNIPRAGPTLRGRGQDLRPAVGRADLLVRVLPAQERRRSWLVLSRTLVELQPLGPSFVSVTYRGGAASRQRTHNLVSGMLHTTTLVPMAHLVCVAHTRLELAEILCSLRKARGWKTCSRWVAIPRRTPAPPGELNHAIELVELARAIGGFSIGVAAQPIGHPALARPRARSRSAGREACPGRLRDHPVLLRARGVPRARRRPARPGDRQADPPGHHAGDRAELDPPHGHHGCRRAAVDGGAPASRRRPRDGRARRRASVRDRTGHRALQGRSARVSGHPGCTSTPSTFRARPGRSTRLSGWRRT
jgi:hypothetical protein